MLFKELLEVHDEYIEFIEVIMDTDENNGINAEDCNLLNVSSEITKMLGMCEVVEVSPHDSRLFVILKNNDNDNKRKEEENNES